MNSIEQLKVALGEPLKRKIGEQEFEFYPLSIIYLQDLFELAGKIQGKKEEILKKENAQILFNLLLKMCENSFPKDTPKDVLDRFVTKFFMELSEILIELHNPDINKLSPQQKSKIEQLKARVQKNVKPTGENQTTSSS